MMTLDYIVDSAKDSVKSVGKPQTGAELLTKYRKRFLKNDKIHSFLYDKDGNKKENFDELENILGNYIEKEYQGSVKDYLSQRQIGTDILRYSGAGLGALGAVAATGGLVAFLLGAPIVGATAAIGAGLTTLIYGAAGSTLADVKEAIDSNAAIDGYQSEEVVADSYIGKALGYVKKGAKGAWEYVKRLPGAVMRNKGQILEGLAHRAAAYGSIKLGLPIAPLAIATDAYRGSSKFRNRVVDKLVDRVADSFASHMSKSNATENIIELKPKDDRMISIYDSPNTDWAYQATQKPQNKVGYVQPRRMTA